MTIILFLQPDKSKSRKQNILPLPLQKEWMVPELVSNLEEYITKVKLVRSMSLTRCTVEHLNTKKVDCVPIYQFNLATLMCLFQTMYSSRFETSSGTIHSFWRGRGKIFCFLDLLLSGKKI
jgi:hypothetical protein